MADPHSGQHQAQTLPQGFRHQPGERLLHIQPTIAVRGRNHTGDDLGNSGLPGA